MTQEHPSRELLCAHADGELTREEERRVDRHLGDCDRCRSYVQRVRTLNDDLRSLPRDVRPSRDLNPLRTGSVEYEEQPRRAAARPRRLGARVALAAAAVVAAVAVGYWLHDGVPWSDPFSGSERIAATAATDAPADQYRAQLQEYEEASRELTALYRQRKEQLPEEAVRHLERSLASIEAAIDRTEEAVEAQPDVLLAREMLVSRYERKIELLRRTLYRWSEQG